MARSPISPWQIIARGTNTVTGTFTWNGGNINGALTIAAGASLLITNGNSCYLPGGGLTNYGSVKMAGYLYSSGTAAIDNRGSWTSQGYSLIEGSQQNAFLNNGLFRVQAAPYYCTVSEAFTNTGVVDVQSGYLQLSEGGWLGGVFQAAATTTVYFNGGAFFAGAPPMLSGLGAFTFNYGNLTLLSDQIRGLTLAGGSVNFGPNFQDHGAITNLALGGATLTSPATVTGALVVQGNSLTQPLTIAAGGTLLLTNGADQNYITFASTWLVNYGTVQWSGVTLQASGASAITNYGLWLCQGDDTFNDNSATFYNYGNFRKDGTAGFTRLRSGAFVNAGSLEARSGTIQFLSNPYGQTAANLIFAASTPGSHGSLSLDTNINFDGSLTLRLTNGYVPNLGDALTLVTYPSHAGSFQNLNLPPLPAGRDWQLEVGSSSVALRVVNSLGAANARKISGTVTDTSHHPVPGVVVYATAGAESANLIQNGSFETPVIPGGYLFYGPPSTTVSPWTVVGPDGDTIAIHSASQYGPAEDGGQYLDLSGGTGGAGASQTFPTVAGAAYDLVFYHSSYNHAGSSAAFSVAIGGSVYTLGETAGYYNNLDWREVVIPFTAGSSSTTVTFMDLNGFDANDNFVDNVQVFPPDSGRALQAVTDSSGHYQIALADGSFQVGVAGLDAAGYNPVPAQTVALAGADRTANFEAEPMGFGQFNIHHPGQSLKRRDDHRRRRGHAGRRRHRRRHRHQHLPAVSVPGWYENNVLVSSSASYTFAATRDRVLVAGFGLPVPTITARNNPAGAGFISGVPNGDGVTNVAYGQTNILTASPVSPYKFVSWTENNTVVGTNFSLTNIVTADHTFLANYLATNYTHYVTATTYPPGVAAVVGGNRGYFNNQSAFFSAPATVTIPPYSYTFQSFAFNGYYVTANNSFIRTITSADPVNLSVVAYYAQQTINPLVVNASANLSSPVPATTNFILSFQFDRSMNTNITPTLQLTNEAAGSTQPPAPGPAIGLPPSPPTTPTSPAPSRSPTAWTEPSASIFPARRTRPARRWLSSTSSILLSSQHRPRSPPSPSPPRPTAPRSPPEPTSRFPPPQAPPTAAASPRSPSTPTAPPSSATTPRRPTARSSPPTPAATPSLPSRWTRPISSARRPSSTSL